MDRPRLQRASEPRVFRNPAEGGEAQSPIRRIPAYLVRRLHLICTAMVAEVVEKDGLSMLQWAVLVHIHWTPDIDQSRLAETASIDKTNTGRLVDQLEAMGLVERRPHGSDRRAWMLRLTTRGEQLRRRLGPRALVSQERLLSCLNVKERNAFLDLLTRVVDANEGYIRPGAGRRKPRARNEAAAKPSENR